MLYPHCSFHCSRNIHWYHQFHPLTTPPVYKRTSDAAVLGKIPEHNSISGNRSWVYTLLFVSMAAHIPTLLSILGTVASNYPPFAAKLAGNQPSQPPPQTAPVVSQPAPPNVSVVPSAPINLPSSAPNGQSLVSSSPGYSSNALCDVRPF